MSRGPKGSRGSHRCQSRSRGTSRGYQGVRGRGGVKVSLRINGVICWWVL